MMNTIMEGKSRREEIVIAIKLFIDKNGYSPTVRELADMVEVKSTSTIHKHLERLKDEQRINWNSSMPRTIVLNRSMEA